MNDDPQPRRVPTSALAPPPAVIDTLADALAARRRDALDGDDFRKVVGRAGDDVRAAFEAALAGVDRADPAPRRRFFRSLALQRWTAGTRALEGRDVSSAIVDNEVERFAAVADEHFVDNEGMTSPVRRASGEAETTMGGVATLVEPWPLRVTGGTRVVSRVRRALSLLEAAWPDVMPLVTTTLSVVELRSDGFTAWSHRDLTGFSAFGRPSWEPATLARMLVHEAQVHRLRWHLEVGGLLQAPDALYTSPWRDAPRPFRRILKTLLGLAGEVVAMERMRARFPRPRPTAAHVEAGLLDSARRGLEVVITYRDEHEGGAHDLLDGLAAELGA